MIKKKERARDRIIRLAADLLVKYGTNSFSTAEVGQAAKVTQPLIHYHFKTKRDLLIESYQWLINNDPDGAVRVATREVRDDRSLLKGKL